MRKLLFTLALPLCVSAQSKWKPLGEHVSIGAIVGTNLTGDFATRTISFNDVTSSTTYTVTSQSGPRRLIVGPTIEFQLPKQFSIEADALYRPLSFKVSTKPASTFGGPWGQTVTDPAWEFPVLAKRRFAVGSIHPFIGAGPAFRQKVFSLTSRFGAVAGAGVDFQWGQLRIAPTVRYTRWGEQAPYTMRRNQSEFLTGFSF